MVLVKILKLRLKLEYFNQYGRRNNTDSYRVFGEKPSFYYKVNQIQQDYGKQLRNLKFYEIINDDINLLEYESRSEKLLNKIKNNRSYKNLTNGTMVPFLYKNINKCDDLGEDLFKYLLNSVGKSFTNKFPNAKFKAILQNKSNLEKNIQIDKRSRYDEFIDLSSHNIVIGWYFPQALQEFDLESQRRQMNELPSSVDFNICLSGGKEICASIVAVPELLINEDDYAPILCLSSYVHVDERMVLTLKSYGPHMEFWSMTQMLTADIKQVSEQWTGGLTIFEKL